MTLLRWSPSRDVLDIFDEFNKLVQETLRRSDVEESDTLRKISWAPRVNISETDDAYFIDVELPGVDKKDVKITFKDHILTIEGEKKLRKEIKEDQFIKKESLYGSFSRSFNLPDDVDGEKIEADYKDGILTVTLPKTEEKKPKEIEVKVK
jgi:HSP20 family protein